MPGVWNKHCSPVRLHINALIQIQNSPFVAECRLINAASRSHCVGCAAEDAGEPPRPLVSPLAWFALWRFRFDWPRNDSPLHCACPNQPSCPSPPTKTLLAFFFFFYTLPHLFVCWLRAWQQSSNSNSQCAGCVQIAGGKIKWSQWGEIKFITVGVNCFMGRRNFKRRHFKWLQHGKQSGWAIYMQITFKFNSIDVSAPILCFNARPNVSPV